MWSRLKFEGGVHRVQRVPVTESQGRVHTSAAGVLVYPEPEEVEEVQIDESDLRIDVYRSSGKGGQGVNTTDSAVRITHLPTGIVVTCQNERSQLQNKARAMLVLAARLQALAEEQASADASADRASQIRTVDRSERIRTYNFPENRIADHRINFKAHNLDQVLDGDLDRAVRRAGRRRQAGQAAADMTTPAARRIDDAAAALAAGGSRLAAGRRRTARRPRRTAPTGDGWRSSSRTRTSSTATATRRQARRAGPAAAPHGTGGVRPGDLQVGPGVFIPRPETESLLEWALAQPFSPQPVIVDLCTGSGALALALARHWPGARVVAVDDSDEALAYARRNLRGHRRRTDPSRRHRSRVCWPNSTARSTSSSPIRPTFPTVRELEPEVAEHDPAHALFGGPDGMAVIDADRRPGGPAAAPRRASAPSSTTTPPSARTVDAFTRAGRSIDVTARHDLPGDPGSSPRSESG